MTVNSFQANQSASVAGLGTQTFNIVTAGSYTLSVKSTLPYSPPGSAQSSPPSPESTNVTFVADSSGSLNSTYFTFNGDGDVHQYYVWFNINSAGVDPAPTGRTGIEVDGATNATAATLATAAIAAVAASSAATYVTASAGASGHMILTNKGYGTATDAANGTASPGFSYSVTQGSDGTPAASNLEIQVKQGSTVLATYGNPSPTQPSMGGNVTFLAAAADVITVVLSSTSSADSLPNAVKSTINLYLGA